MNKHGLLCFILVFLFCNSSGQNKLVNWQISVQPQHAWFLVHSNSVANYRGVTGNGLQIELNRERRDETAYAYAGCYYNSGFSLQVMNFTGELGRIANLGYFIEPYLAERRNFSLRLRAAGGVNFASDPNTGDRNTANRAYSSYVNGYLGLGFSMHQNLSKTLNGFVSFTYSHFSNGNTKNPNSGVNYPHIGAGITYQFRTTTPPIGNTLFYAQKWRFDGGIFVCNKSLPVLPDERFWAYGLFTGASRQVRKIHAVTFSLEAYTDQSMRKVMDLNPYYASRHYSSNLLGLLVGHEFLFNKCIFSQQLGIYLFKEVPGVLINRVYHRWGFNYKLSRNIMAGINLNANLQKAFILDLRLAFSLYSKN